MSYTFHIYLIFLIHIFVKIRYSELKSLFGKGNIGKTINVKIYKIPLFLATYIHYMYTVTVILNGSHFHKNKPFGIGQQQLSIVILLCKNIFDLHRSDLNMWATVMDGQVVAAAGFKNISLCPADTTTWNASTVCGKLFCD